MDSANLQEILTCRICLETFDEGFKWPRMLSCGHSFCHSCLVKLLAQNPCCPTCKDEILFQNTESIPINFSLKSLINISSQILMPNTYTNLEGGISDTIQTGGPAKCEPITSNSKYLSEGYCDEHNIYKGMRCMDCEVWICGMCSSLQHKHCRTLVVEEAYKELKKQVSQRVEEELGQRKTTTERLTESLRVLEKNRRSLIEEIKRKELELVDHEKRIQELESLKAEENKFCDKLKELQIVVENSANNAEFSKNLIELEKLLQEGKKQIPFDLPSRHLSKNRAALERLCLNGSVYAVEVCYGATCSCRYGKVAMKDGRILVNSFQLIEKPEKAALLLFPGFLSLFNNGSKELPKTVFLRVTPLFHDGGKDDSFEVIIETDGLTPRAKNCILLCSALKGPSYKGKAMTSRGYSSYYIYSAPPPFVAGIRNDDPRTPLKEGGVYGLFWITLEDNSSDYLPKFGVVIAGLQQLKELQGRNCSIEECGLVL